MRPLLRKFMLSLHITTSVGLLGAIAGFLVLALTGITADIATAHAAYLATQLITVWVIVPLAFASLIIGLIESLGTKWGLVRHYWIVAKLALTVIAVFVLLLQLDNIAYLARADAAMLPDLWGTRASLVLHSAGGLIVLLLVLGLSVYKPRGRLPPLRKPAPAN